MTALMPALSAISTQSEKGKNASEAITAPSRLNPKLRAFSMACLRASTLDVWPMPLAIILRSLASTMALDLECFTMMLAKSISAICSFVGSVEVTVLRSSGLSLKVSLSCTSTPESIERNFMADGRAWAVLRMMRFFFPSSI